jgi:hypothetical protein
MNRKLPTTILGTGYELHCLRLLQEQLRMSLTRVGGRGDGGVDLRGWWNLPQTTLSPLPRLIREMEGVARREHDLGEETRLNDTESSSASQSIITLLCSRSGFTPAAVIEANRSRIPTLLLHIPFDYEAELLSRAQPITHAVDHELLDSMPTLRGAFWNAAMMGTRGVLGDGWEVRKEFAPGVEEDFRIAVHFNGRPI